MPYQSLALSDFPDPDPIFLEVVKGLPALSRRGPWLAGGSVRKFMNRQPNLADYDIFFTSQTQMDDFCRQLEAEPVQTNIFNKTYEINGKIIQCIHHEFRSTLIQTMDRFDISICQFGFDGTNLVWSEQASQDVREGKLHFLATNDPVYNFNRAFKYASQGFVPADGEVKKVLTRVASGKETVKNNRKISSYVKAAPVDVIVTTPYFAGGPVGDMSAVIQRVKDAINTPSTGVMTPTLKTQFWDPNLGMWV